jgi:hypothetical protein
MLLVLYQYKHTFSLLPLLISSGFKSLVLSFLHLINVSNLPNILQHLLSTDIPLPPTQGMVEIIVQTRSPFLNFAKPLSPKHLPPSHTVNNEHLARN